jgi:hypothetical protein
MHKYEFHLDANSKLLSKNVYLSKAPNGWENTWNSTERYPAFQVLWDVRLCNRRRDVSSSLARNTYEQYQQIWPQRKPRKAFRDGDF